MKNLFIAYTPYHILLSHGLVEDMSGEIENYLIIFSDFIDKKALKYLQETKLQSQFNEILYYASGTDLRLFTRLKRQLIMWKNVRFITKFVKKHKFDRVYVFNDLRMESQAALHFVRRRNKNSMIIYVEDGISVYHTSPLTYWKKSVFASVIKKIIYGLWLDNTLIPGTTKWID